MSAPALVPNRITPVTQSEYEQTYGGSLVCCQVMLVLYGISVLQTWLYYLRYDKDSLYLKLMVFVLWALATVHAIFVCHTVYHYLVLSYTRPLSVIDGEWSVYAATCVGVVISFIVQTFFARMIFQLMNGRRKWVLGACFFILISAQIAFGILLSVKLFQIWLLPDLKQAVYIAMAPLFLVRVVSDTLTAVTLCIVLYDASNTLFGRSAHLAQSLLVYAVNRFLLTTVVVVVQTIILLVRPDTVWAMVMEFVCVHLYVNSLIATLNCRNHLREVGTDIIISDSNMPRSAIHFKKPRSPHSEFTSGDTSGNFLDIHSSQQHPRSLSTAVATRGDEGGIALSDFKSPHDWKGDEGGTMIFVTDPAMAA